MMTKEAQNQIIANSFQDELFKIAAADVLGDPNVDWDNLSDEQLEKLAKWFPGKFLARGLGAGAKAIKNTAQAVGKGAKASGKYLGGKFKDVGQGVKQVAEGVGDVAKGTVKGVGGAIKGTAEIGKDVVEGAAKTVGKAGKAVVGAGVAGAAAVGTGAKKWGEGLKDEFQTGAGTKKETPSDGAAAAGAAAGADAAGKRTTSLDRAKERLAKNVEAAGLKGKTGTATLKGGKLVPGSQKIKGADTTGKPEGIGSGATVTPPKGSGDAEPGSVEGTAPKDTAAKIPSKGQAAVAKPKRSNFGNAFASARKAGKSEFKWNGRSYNTKMA